MATTTQAAGEDAAAPATAVDQKEKARLLSLQQALRLTARASGINSTEAQTLRSELDIAWQAVRSGMSHQEQDDSIGEEIVRLEGRAEVVGTRIIEMEKEMAEAKEEMELLARRVIMFRTQQDAVRKLVAGKAKPTVQTGSDQQAEQIQQLQNTILSLVQALAAQAPTVVQGMNPQILATLTAQAAQQPPHGGQRCSQRNSHRAKRLPRSPSWRRDRRTT